MGFWSKLAQWFDPPEADPPKFQPEWIETLTARIPLYGKLPPELQERLHQKLTLFVAQKNFEACGGLVLTDEMVLTVAGQACLLVMNRPGPPFPKLRSILIYPSAYRATHRSVDSLGIVTEKEVVRLGESSSNGTVVLAWDSVLEGALNSFDGHNVALHEFAHQLDQAHGSADGTPRLASPCRYAPWSQVLEAGHRELSHLKAKRKRSVLDKYGATNHAEYFAVATEAFFEKPRQLARKRPELYAELQAYYHVDPALWFNQG